MPSPVSLKALAVRQPAKRPIRKPLQGRPLRSKPLPGNPFPGHIAGPSAAGDPASAQNAARMQAGQQAAAGAAMQSDESLHLSLRDNPGHSGARRTPGFGDRRGADRLAGNAFRAGPAGRAGKRAIWTRSPELFDEGAAFMREAGPNLAAQAGEMRGGETRGADMRGGASTRRSRAACAARGPGLPGL